MRTHAIKHLLVVLGFTAVGVAFVAYLLSVSGALPSLGDSYRVNAYLPTSSQLATGSRVTMAGAKVGEVKSVERRGVGAIVELELTDDRVTPIPRDSTVALRARTPVGENYIAIQPGRSKTPLPSSAVLETDPEEEFVDVDQILTTLRGKSRAGARRMIQSLSYGLDGRGRRLNAVAADGSRLVTDGAVLVDVLNRDREQLSRLIDGLGRVSNAIGERDGAIGQLARDGLTSFRALASRDAALRRLLNVLPATLDQVRTTTATLRTTSGQATPVLVQLAHAMREIRPAVRRLQPAAVEGRAAVDELGKAAPSLQATLGQVRALAKPAPEAFAQIRQTLCQVNPAVRYLAPYKDDLLAVVAALGSASNSYDATGHLLRLLPIVDENSLVGLPPQINKAANQLVHSGLLATTAGRLEYQPFPKPGEIGTSKAQPGGATGPDDVLENSGFKYPRIEADC